MSERAAGRGRVIAYEGLDGAGKSTQIRRVADALTANDCRVQVLKLTGNRGFKNLCRALNTHDLLGPVEAALMKASELSGRVELLGPLLDAGVIVIWDKFIVGSVAADVARGVSQQYTDALAVSLPPPDLTVYLEITPAEALSRKRQADGPRVMESGLDVKLGVSARRAHVMWAAGEIDAETVDRCFLSFQKDTADAYERYLPTETTLRLDARLCADELADATMQHVNQLLQVPAV
jgi:dTMP kinase